MCIACEHFFVTVFHCCSSGLPWGDTTKQDKTLEQFSLSIYKHANVKSGAVNMISDLCGDAADEALDVELRGAGLLAGRVGALEAAARLAQGRALAQRGVLYVVKVLEEGRARPKTYLFPYQALIP